jgi:imidazolonepropionase-like amidohydrolase
VDGRGKFLLPGLAEMHAHVPGGNAPDADIERVLLLYAANGITTIRGMLGHPRHLELRAKLARGDILGPRLVTSGPSLNGSSVPDWATAQRLVAEQKAAGYDFLKIHPGIAQPAFDSLAAAAARAGMRLAGHVPLDVGLEGALRHRFWTIDHLDGYAEALAEGNPPAPAPASQFFGANLAPWFDESRMAELVRRTRDAGVAQVPTEILFDNLAEPDGVAALRDRPEHRYVSRQALEQWAGQSAGIATQLGPTALRDLVAMRRRLLRALHDGGVSLVLGSDAPQIWNVPGFSMHRELEALVQAGLTPYQALRTGTVNVAALLGEPAPAGTVAVGARADLLLLDANPLDEVSRSRTIAGVMLAGRWLPRAELDRLLEGAARAVGN